MRMLSATSWLSLALFLALFCHALSLELSFHNSKSPHGINDRTRCSWNCTVPDSDFSEEIKTLIAKKKVVPLVVKYETRVTEQCENQTSRISSGNITEHWQIWLPSKQVSVFAKALESVANLMFYTDSNGDNEEIRAICNLRPVNTTAAKPTYDSGFFPTFSESHLADLGVTFDSIDCNIVTADNMQLCISIIEKANNSITLKGLFKFIGWPGAGLVFFQVVFSSVFIYYSPAFLTFLSPTEVTEHGVRQIILEGASPVSLRSWIGNYFFSKEDDTIWQRARMFILRGVVLPFPFLAPAMFVEYWLQKLGFLIYKIVGFSPSLLHPVMIVSYVCYYIMACFTSFFWEDFKSEFFSPEHRPCFICRRIKSKTLNCQENLPKGIRNHLRIQPLILVECSKLFIRYLSIYFEKCLFDRIPSSFEVSLSFVLRMFLFIVLLSASPVVTIILLILILVAIFIALFLTSPAVTILSEATKHGRPVSPPRDRYIRFLSFHLCIMFGGLISLPAVGASLAILSSASVGVYMAIVSPFVFLLTEEDLPFAACSVLVLYYIWSSYSSFTNKYQDLGLALFKHYKSRHSQVTDMNLNTDSLPENTQNSVGNKDNLMKIPKGLFHMAYEELMPIRESVCALILKVTLIVSFVFFVFSLIMVLNVSATPVMTALMTFLSGSLPKIVAIYMDRRRQKNIEAMAADEKIPLIVQEYLEGTSAVNQGQENSGVDIDEEMLQDMNEENIELVVM